MPIRIYADTSVYGGVFDSGIDVASRQFFEQVKNGYFELVTSSVVADELTLAPERVILPRKPVRGFVKESSENGRNAKQVCAAI